MDFSNLINYFKNQEIQYDDSILEKFEIFYKEMVRVNETMNLTGITEWEEVVKLHYIDSVSLIPFVRDHLKGSDISDEDSSSFEKYVSGLRILDMGTGAGFPGVPLAICLPNCSFVLADSLRKRIDYLEAVSSKMGLSNVENIHARAEDLAKDADYRESFDLVVSRAVADSVVLSEYCIPFVKEGGYFIAYKSGEVDEEIERAKSGIRLLGGEVEEVSKFTLPDSDIARSFILIKKVLPTPDTYPRRAGVPLKKPLK